MTTALEFPDSLPPGFAWIEDEPAFDPVRHLAVEAPRPAYSLADLGYEPADIEPTATPIAVSHPFRVLSDEGAAIMLETARRLKTFRRPAGDRIENSVRGGCYRSRWLRDLSLDPTVTEAMGAFYGAAVAPHTMPLHLAHLNYEPTTVDASVDKWHHDTIPLDYVMMVTDPATLEGGQFEYFVGTKAEAAELASRGEVPPPDRIVAPEFPAAGYAIALHGNMVVHRGAPLAAPGERITMVNAYVALDTSKDDQSRSRDLIAVDPADALYAEWARHAAWRARTRLERLEETMAFGVGPEDAAAMLEAAIADAQQAIDEMRHGETAPEHYEQRA